MAMLGKMAISGQKSSIADEMVKVRNTGNDFFFFSFV